MVRILLSTRLGERKWTQADLSRMTGIRPNTISELYHEVATRISIDHIDLICEALGCGISDLIEVVPNKEPVRAFPLSPVYRFSYARIELRALGGARGFFSA